MFGVVALVSFKLRLADPFYASRITSLLQPTFVQLANSAQFDLYSACTISEIVLHWTARWDHDRPESVPEVLVTHHVHNHSYQQSCSGCPVQHQCDLLYFV